MRIDKILFVSLVLNDVIGDVIEDGQVGLRGEHHVVVTQVETAVFKRR